MDFETTEANEVYGVSTGEYSNYQVIGIFTTEEKRDAYLEELQKIDSGAFAEDFQIDPVVAATETRVRVFMRKNGDIVNVQQILEYASRRVFDEYYEDHRTREPAGCIILYMRSDTVERAVKAANEKRAQLLALGIWGDFGKTWEFFEANRGESNAT